MVVREATWKKKKKKVKNEEGEDVSVAGSPSKVKESEITEVPEQQDQEVVVEEEPEPRHAERFDFTFNNVFYALNIEVDEYGERITSRTWEQGRIISQDGFAREEETIYSEEEYDEDGNYFPRENKPIIPPQELKVINYF